MQHKFVTKTTPIARIKVFFNYPIYTKFTEYSFNSEQLPTKSALHLETNKKRKCKVMGCDVSQHAELYLHTETHKNSTHKTLL